MEEGTILEWRVSVGDRIAPGDILCEIETDKAAIEYESPVSGRLARIVAEEGETVEVKRPIAYFAENDADLESLLKEQSAGDDMAISGQPSVAATVAATTDSSAGQLRQGQLRQGQLPRGQLPSVTGSRIRVSPAARRRAREKGVDISAVGAGSGPGGRILSTDLESVEILDSVPLASPTSGPGDRQLISKKRRAIGQRLQESKQTIPHFYVRATVRADKLYAAYKQQVDSPPCSLNDFVVLASGRVLQEFPAFRSRLDGDALVKEAGSHVGIAVGLDDNLVVPVVLDVQKKSLTELAVAIKKIVEEARNGKVAGYGRGVFTISNLGMFGVEEFSAIINPPEAAILAVGAVREAVVVENGWMRPGRVMTITLSCDHRVVDGVAAAKFIARLKELLESPDQLLALSTRA